MKAIFLMMIITGLALPGGAQSLHDRYRLPQTTDTEAFIHPPHNAAGIRTFSFNNNVEQARESVPQPIANNIATLHLPFFCRQELMAEKRLGVPLRLRLGSVQYTDWLEQKPGAVAPR